MPPYLRNSYFERRFLMIPQVCLLKIDKFIRIIHVVFTEITAMGS